MKAPFTHIKNHGSTAAQSGLAPWDFVPANPLPEFADKDEFRRWSLHSATDHYFFSTYEGLNDGLRVSDENPPMWMSGIVADYDSPVLDGDWAGLKLRGSADFPAQRGSETQSGNARLVWLFEAPILVYEKAAHAEFLKRLEKELKLKKLLPGFDEGAFLNTKITYECGVAWRELAAGAVIPTSALVAWLYDAGKKGNWASKGEIVVPLDRVRAEVEAKWPGAWPGEFAEGARGPRFWDQTANNPTAAVIRANGMQCFTGGQSFVTWREILGHRFVEEFQEDRISQAIGEVYFDGRHYWMRVAGRWQTHSKEDTILHFKAGCGLRSDKGGGDAASEAENALYAVQKRNRVDSALPLVHQTPGVVFREGRRVLNISSCEVVQPQAAGDQALAWGEGFPFIREYLDGFFTSPVQLERFLAWLKRFYESAYARDLLKGQSLFIAGPVQTGKTLLANVLIGELLGGSMDASTFLLGETNFNSGLYGVPVWTVNDSTPGTDARAHAKFSANVKKVAANQSFEFLAKFRDAATISWLGRPVTTLNDDAESMRILPDADTNILDKVMLFRAADRKFKFPVKADALIRAELPALGRWLLEWATPEACLGDNRYGILSYHEPMLLGEARRAGKSGEFRELLAAFREVYFSVHTDDRWEGTSTQLVQAMTLDDSLREIIRQQRFSATSIGRELQKLQARGYSVERRTLHGYTHWTIRKADEFEREEAA